MPPPQILQICTSLSFGSEQLGSENSQNCEGIFGLSVGVCGNGGEKAGQQFGAEDCKLYFRCRKFLRSLYPHPQIIFKYTLFLLFVPVLKQILALNNMLVKKGGWV